MYMKWWVIGRAMDGWCRDFHRVSGRRSYGFHGVDNDWCWSCERYLQVDWGFPVEAYISDLCQEDYEKTHAGSSYFGGYN